MRNWDARFEGFSFPPSFCQRELAENAANEARRSADAAEKRPSSERAAHLKLPANSVLTPTSRSKPHSKLLVIRPPRTGFTFPPPTGPRPLSHRKATDHEILALAGSGLSIPEIAARLDVDGECSQKNQAADGPRLNWILSQEFPEANDNGAHVYRGHHGQCPHCH